MRMLAYVLGAILNLMLYAGAREVGDLAFLQAFALLAVLNFIAILLHELGHAWAFRYVGGSVQKIAVMFLTFDVRQRRLSYNSRLIGSDIGGYVAGRYAQDRPTVRALITVAAAGPVANAISGGAALLVAAWIGAPSTNLADAVAIADGQPPMSAPARLPTEAAIDAALAHWDVTLQSLTLLNLGYTALMLFGVLSLGLGVLNLLPFAGSDGQSIARALKLLRAMSSGKHRP